MLPITEHIHGTASVAAGWQIGILVIDGDSALLDSDSGEMVIDESDIVEVRNGQYWEQVSGDDFLKKTAEGWPLLAGMTVRVRHGNADMNDCEEECGQAGEAAVKLDEKVYVAVNDALEIPHRLTCIESDLRHQGYIIERGVAGSVIIKLNNGEVHYVPAGMCIKQIIFSYQRE
ncbi:MAG: hypothetical protein FH756_02205 [Firmicutes bacterium]|nr:hypothetical protein [Bacillota bacterium]